MAIRFVKQTEAFLCESCQHCHQSCMHLRCPCYSRLCKKRCQILFFSQSFAVTIAVSWNLPFSPSPNGPEGANTGHKCKKRKIVGDCNMLNPIAFQPSYACSFWDEIACLLSAFRLLPSVCLKLLIAFTVESVMSIVTLHGAYRREPSHKLRQNTPLRVIKNLTFNIRKYWVILFFRLLEAFCRQG